MTIGHIASEAMDSDARACLPSQCRCCRCQPLLVTAADHNMIATSSQLLTYKGGITTAACCNGRVLVPELEGRQ